MKKFLLTAAVCFCGFAALAWPGCPWGPPPPPHHHHCHGYSGVRLASDIVNLVGASMNLFTPRTTVVVPATPVVQPVVVTQPVVVQPAVQPVVVQQPAVQTVTQPVVVQQPGVQTVIYR